MVVRLSVHFRPVSTVCKAKASVNRRIIEDEGATSTHGGQCWRASQPTEPVCPSTAAFILTGMTGGRRRHGIGIQSWRPGLARRGQLTSGDDDDVRPLPRKLLYASLLPGRPAGRPAGLGRHTAASGHAATTTAGENKRSIQIGDRNTERAATYGRRGDWWRWWLDNVRSSWHLAEQTALSSCRTGYCCRCRLPSNQPRPAVGGPRQKRCTSDCRKEENKNLGKQETNRQQTC